LPFSRDDYFFASCPYRYARQPCFSATPLSIAAEPIISLLRRLPPLAAVFVASFTMRLHFRLPIFDALHC
jgi:hypothetical protein